MNAEESTNKDTEVIESAAIPPADPDREKFDHELTRALSEKTREVRELEIKLARSDEAARIFANLFIFLVVAILFRSVYLGRQ